MKDMSGKKADEMVEIEFRLPARIPMVPNCVFVPGSIGDEMIRVSIGDLSDEQLKDIADAWGCALLRRAEEIRNTPQEEG